MSLDMYLNASLFTLDRRGCVELVDKEAGNLALVKLDSGLYEKVEWDDDAFAWDENRVLVTRKEAEQAVKEWYQRLEEIMSL